MQIRSRVDRPSKQARASAFFCPYHRRLRLQGVSSVSTYVVGRRGPARRRAGVQHSVFFWFDLLSSVVKINNHDSEVVVLLGTVVSACCRLFAPVRPCALKLTNVHALLRFESTSVACCCCSACTCAYKRGSYWEQAVVHDDMCVQACKRGPHWEQAVLQYCMMPVYCASTRACVCCV